MKKKGGGEWEEEGVEENWMRVSDEKGGGNGEKLENKEVMEK
jgi:hypothetical protein